MKKVDKNIVVIILHFLTVVMTEMQEVFKKQGRGRRNDQNDRKKEN